MTGWWLKLWLCFEIALGVLLGAGCIVCTIDWVRNGCPVPRKIHVLAVLLLVLGGLTGTWRLATGVGRLPGTVLWFVLPPLWAYAGWLLMLGPWLKDEGQKDRR